MSERNALTLPGARPLRITHFLAVAWTVLSLAVTVYNVLTDLLATSIPAALDVAPFWQKVNPTLELDGIHAAVTGGGFDHASFMISGLGLDARLWYAGANLVEGAASAMLGITVALLCSRVAEGNPFASVVPRAFTVSGVTVLFGGFLWQIFNQIAGLRVIEETFHAYGYSFRTNVPGNREGAIGWPSGSENFAVSFWPLAAALGLFAIAVVFRYGTQLSRERAELVEEVKGLV
jgi:hypothetical protein